VIDEHAPEFAGKPVQEWSEESGIASPEQYCYRIALDWDSGEDGQRWTDRFASFLEDPNAAQVTGLIVGSWGYDDMMASSADIVEALVAARERLPNLKALFIGDIISEECEISWIVQSDVSPIFSAYPQLEYFRIRGANSLRFGGLQHARLKSLIVESGGLSGETLRDVMSAQLPALEHLELWLGESGYGWSGELDDLAPLFAGALFPNLRYLGLRDSEIADEIAAAIADAPILQRIRVLDLSLGTLTDVGGEALLYSPFLTRLEKLDLHRHYLSPQMIYRLTGVRSESIEMEPALPGLDAPSTPPPGTVIEIDVSDPQQEEEYKGEKYRYVAVGE
jgi:hypothetical protein